MQHSNLHKWEKKLNQMFDEIDDYLEDKYGELYTLHPARPRRGSTANKSHDGLFNVGAAFSTGLGSQHGPGYVVEVRLVTLDYVPPEVHEEIKQEVVEILKRKLPLYFPEQELEVARDGNVYKIFGDLKLGRL